MSRLIKVEILRFFHSLEIIKYAIIATGLVFFLPAVEFMNLEKEQLTDEVVWSALGITCLYIVMLCAAVIGSYVGREFSQKTLYYEIMSGYTPLQICVSKMVTSGLFLSLIMAVALLIYLITFSITLNSAFFIRFFLQWLIMLHFTCCTTLYTIIAQNGIIGGCLAFLRFVLVETMIISGLLLAPQKVIEFCGMCMTTKQWVKVSNGMPDKGYIVSIIVGFFVETVVLLTIANRCMKKRDFQ